MSNQQAMTHNELRARIRELEGYLTEEMKATRAVTGTLHKVLNDFNTIAVQNDKLMEFYYKVEDVVESLDNAKIDKQAFILKIKHHLKLYVEYINIEKEMAPC